MRSVTVAVLTIVVALSAGSAFAASANPETDKHLGPGDGAGHYFGGQSSTGQFHGCRRSDDQWLPRSLQSGQPTLTPSTHRYVTFKVDGAGFPTFSWKAKAGYKICGVEAFALLSGPGTQGGQYLTWIAYTSGAKSGSTDAKGKETVKVHTPKDLGEEQADLKVFAGKTLTIDGFQTVSVYVKKT